MKYLMKTNGNLSREDLGRRLEDDQVLLVDLSQLLAEPHLLSVRD